MHNPSSKGKRSVSLLGSNSELTHHFISLYILVTKSLPHMFPITSTRSGLMLGMDSLNPSSILTSSRKQNLPDLRNWIPSISRCSGDEAELGDDSQADDEEVQDLLAKDTQESEDQSDENSDSPDNDTEEEESNDDYEDVNDDDVPTEQQQPPIIPDPFPVAHADTNFIQTFIANIFIF